VTPAGGSAPIVADAGGPVPIATRRRRGGVAGAVQAGDERAIRALRAAGRIGPTDGAMVANLRAAGRALDVLGPVGAALDPAAYAALLRAHLAAAVALSRVVASSTGDATDELLRQLLSPPTMGDAAHR